MTKNWISSSERKQMRILTNKEKTNQFKDVLYTMQDIDVAGWVRSLQLRGIELPDDLKDEVFLIIGERRNGER